MIPEEFEPDDDWISLKILKFLRTCSGEELYTYRHVSYLPSLKNPSIAIVKSFAFEEISFWILTPFP